MLGQIESFHDVAVSVNDIGGDDPVILRTHKGAGYFAAVSNPLKAGHQNRATEKNYGAYPKMQTVAHALCCRVAKVCAAGPEVGFFELLE